MSSNWEEDGDGDDEAEGDDGDEERGLEGFGMIRGVPRLDSETLDELTMAPINDLPLGTFSPVPPSHRPSFRDEHSEDSAAPSDTEIPTNSAVGYWQEEFHPSLLDNPPLDSLPGLEEGSPRGVVCHQPLPDELIGIPTSSGHEHEVSTLSDFVGKLALDKYSEPCSERNPFQLHVPVATATPTVNEAVAIAGTPSPPPAPRAHPQLRVPVLARTGSIQNSCSIDPLDILGNHSPSSVCDSNRDRVPSLFELEPPSPTSPLFPKTSRAQFGRGTSEDWLKPFVSTVVPSFDPGALETIFSKQPSVPPQPVEMER